MSAVRKSYFGCQGLLTERDARNTRIYIAWLLGMCVLWVAASLAITHKFGPPAVSWTLTAAMLIVSIWTVRSYLRFLREADELLRKIQLEGLAFGYGAGVVFMMVWRLFERLGAPKLDFSDPIVVMMLASALGQYLGTRRYASTTEE